MKALGRIAAALALGALLVTPAMAQEKVTIYSAAPQDLIDNVVPAFEKATKIKVELIKGGSGDLINRLKAEAGRKTADVLFSVSTDVVEANSKLFAKYTPENVKFLADAFKVNDAAVPFTAVATSFGVNTKLLTPAQYPKTWIDLGNPIYKGKISAGRPDKSGSAYIQLALILQIYGEEKGWDDLYQDSGQCRAFQQFRCRLEIRQRWRGVRRPVQRRYAAAIQGRRRPG